MNFEEIKIEVRKLPQEQQNQLAAFLVSLRHERDVRIRHEITTHIDDRNPDNWTTLAELKEKWKV